jgi:hypothetical protein
LNKLPKQSNDHGNATAGPTNLNERIRVKMYSKIRFNLFMSLSCCFSLRADDMDSGVLSVDEWPNLIFRQGALSILELADMRAARWNARPRIAAKI